MVLHLWESRSPPRHLFPKPVMPLAYPAFFFSGASVFFNNVHLYLQACEIKLIAAYTIVEATVEATVDATVDVAIDAFAPYLFFHFSNGSDASPGW